MKDWVILLPAIFLSVSLQADPASEKPIQLQRDIVYRTVEGVDLKLDLAMPTGPGPYPLILALHGGAWHVGDKSKFTGMIENMARHDYVAASVNYRLAPAVKFPAPLEDSKAALLFLKQHATDYNIDITRIGGTGESAGAHMILLMAFDAAGKHEDQSVLTSTRMEAIVNYYAPVDLSQWQVSPMMDFVWQQHFHEPMEQTLLKFFGCTSRNGAEVKKYSPLFQVCRECPPVLTFHGTIDPIVSFHQAELLHDALKKAGVTEQLIPIPNGMHGGWGAAKDKADAQAIKFFDEHLKGAGTAAQPQTRERKLAAGSDTSHSTPAPR